MRDQAYKIFAYMRKILKGSQQSKHFVRIKYYCFAKCLMAESGSAGIELVQRKLCAKKTYIDLYIS
jgi:hypothetical protein